MPALLGELGEYFSPGLDLTVRGKVYTVPLASAELGLWCRTVATASGEFSSASDDDEVRKAVDRITALPQLPGDMTLAQRLLGTAYEQMVADKVPDIYIEFCTETAYIWIIAGEEQAKRYWEAGGRPEALRPGNRASRRAAATGASGTAAGTGTPSPGRTSGTKSRRRSGSRKNSR